jgi:GR25 family glycosyltransferase involved in LPS biosynthesis
VFNFNQKIEDLIDKMGEKSMLVSKDCKGKVLETPFILYKDMMTLNKMTVEYGDFVTEMGKCDKKNKKYINPFIKRHPDKGGMKDMKYFKNTIKTSKKLKDLQQQVKTRALKRVEENPDIAKDNLSGVSVYYINLARSLDRFGWMKTQEKDLNISLTRLEAVDGKKLTSITNGKYTFEDESVLKYRTIPEGSESIYEIACTLSHLNAIKTAYDNGDEAALILEDDVNLYTIPLWDTTLQEIIDNAPDNWGMLHIGQMHTNLDTGVYKQKHDWGLFAYILKRDIMKMILDITYDVSNNQMDLSYGDLVSNGSTLVSDWYISSYVHKLKRMYLTRPYIVPLNSETLNSTIHNEHTNTHQQQCFDILKSFNVIEKYTRSIPKTIHQI